MAGQPGQGWQRRQGGQSLHVFRLGRRGKQSRHGRRKIQTDTFDVRIDKGKETYKTNGIIK